MKVPDRNNVFLVPLSILYGWCVALRNFFYDREWKKSKQYDIPVICIGNLSVGGTGKTPMISFIANELIIRGYKVAIVSRGYKRKSKGLQLASPESTAIQLGDEPYLLKLHCPKAIIAVDCHRQRALDYLSVLPRNERPELILLDDGFQHRSVLPKISILLTTYAMPYYIDRLLPIGNLRESKKNRFRAKAVVVTKCPSNISPMDMRIIHRNLDLYAHQKVYFTFTEERPPMKIFDEIDHSDLKLTLSSPVILMAGIAHPKHFFNGAKERFTNIREEIEFPDHYLFKEKDIVRINDLARKSFIITTEKDAVRLLALSDMLSFEAKSKLYYLPLSIHFIGNNGQDILELLCKEINESKNKQKISLEQTS